MIVLIFFNEWFGNEKIWIDEFGLINPMSKIFLQCLTVYYGHEFLI